MLQKNWQDLIKPEKLVTEAGVDAGRTATIVAEPLERGFGLTLGNALRRVLLSSLQGAAVTSIKIDNVLHEFSSIPGVREDVVDIVLNIKAMAVKMQGDRPQRLYLRAVGPGEVTGQVGPEVALLDGLVEAGQRLALGDEVADRALARGCRLGLRLARGIAFESVGDPRASRARDTDRDEQDGQRGNARHREGHDVHGRSCLPSASR